MKNVDNIKIYKDKGYVEVSVNPRIYPIDIVYSASYVFMDKCFVVLDGDPKKKVIVKLRPKDKNKGLEEIGRDFNDELLNYAVYNVQSEKSRVIKEAIVQKALFTNQGKDIYEDSPEEGFEENMEDPLDIARPWEDNKGDSDTPSKKMSYVDDPLNIANPWGETSKEE